MLPTYSLVTLLFFHCTTLLPFVGSFETIVDESGHDLFHKVTTCIFSSPCPSPSSAAAEPQRTGAAAEGIGDGQVEEPHGAQPVVQGAQERHQEAQAPAPGLHQGDGPEVPEEPEVLKEAQRQGW